MRDKIINKIIAIEGGYVNDPSDSGGETKYGITKAVAKSVGYMGEMIDMPKIYAYNVYEKKYWNGLSLSVILPIVGKEVTEELADTAVNMGVSRAAKFLQRSLNVLNNKGNHYADITVDGSIGKETIKALEQLVKVRGSEGKVVLFNMLNCLQGAFYVELAERREKDETFIFGWFKNRIS